MRYTARYLPVQASIGLEVLVPYTKDEYEDKKFESKGTVVAIEGNIVTVEIQGTKGKFTVPFPYKYIHKLFLCSRQITEQTSLVYDLVSKTFISVDDDNFDEIKNAFQNYFIIEGEILTEGIKEGKQFGDKSKNFLTLKSV